jgi:hypothetical protein
MLGHVTPLPDNAGETNTANNTAAAFSLCQFQPKRQWDRWIAIT